MDIKPPKIVDPIARPRLPAVTPRSAVPPAPAPQPVPAPPLAVVKLGRLSITLSRRHLIFGGAGVLGMVAVVVGVLILTHQPPKASDVVVTKRAPTASPNPSPTPAVFYAPLTGLPVSEADAKRPVTGVMVENLYPDARPQSGLSSAGLVYEALAEGGITRFLALFQQPYPANIGPVRSLRPYYLDWGLEHNVPVAHAGGSQPAMAAIIPRGLKDINALNYDGSYFIRTRDRYAPHNLFTTASLLGQIVDKLGFNQAPTFTPFTYKADAKTDAQSHGTVKIPFSTFAYNAEYRYNAANNTYLRWEGGVAQVDHNTGYQIEIKNLIVQFNPVSYGTQQDGKPETDYNLIGTGKILVFVDGGVVTGTWSKAAHNAQTYFVDDAGNPIALNRGNTWISVVPNGTAVTY